MNRTERHPVPYGKMRLKVVSVMSTLLLVGGSDEQGESLARMLCPLGLALQPARDETEALYLASHNDFDLILIHAPLPNASGKDLAIRLSEQTTSLIVMLVRPEMQDQLTEELDSYGILLLSRPLNRPAFLQSIRFALAARDRLSGFKKENLQLQNKLEEIRLVDRAKCVLIEYLGMTEAAAHRYIEKQAMDLRKTKVQIAEGILKTYEA